MMIQSVNLKSWPVSKCDGKHANKVTIKCPVCNWWFSVCQIVFHLASLGINLCRHWTGSIFVKWAVFGFVHANIQLSFICQDFDVWPRLMSSPIMMSTLRFGWCQHLDLNEVDIFLWKMRGISACSYSRAVPQTWLITLWWYWYIWCRYLC